MKRALSFADRLLLNDWIQRAGGFLTLISLVGVVVVLTGLLIGAIDASVTHLAAPALLLIALGIFLLLLRGGAWLTLRWRDRRAKASGSPASKPNPAPVRQDRGSSIARTRPIEGEPLLAALLREQQKGRKL